jgi:hypothetical protein
MTAALAVTTTQILDEKGPDKRGRPARAPQLLWSKDLPYGGGRFDLVQSPADTSCTGPGWVFFFLASDAITTALKTASVGEFRPASCLSMALPPEAPLFSPATSLTETDHQ